MKKLDRLLFIERKFGKEFALPYIPCNNKSEIIEAVRKFESDGFTWGLRTDLVDGKDQGFLLPFLLEGKLDLALKIFEVHKEKLIYIVSHNILNYACNGVARPIDEMHVLFEINDRDNVSQRHMYDNPKNLRQIIIGEGRIVLYENNFYSCFKPEDNYPYDLRLSIIYSLIVGRKDVDEITFSVRNPDKKVVIW